MDLSEGGFPGRMNNNSSYKSTLTKIKNGRWYIWLSFPAFVFLWGDTSIRILVMKKNSQLIPKYQSKHDVWIRAVGNAFLLAIPLFFIPAFALGALIDYAENFGSALENTINIISLVILYVLGVFITYMHTMWREKNLFPQNE